jgi:lipoprotein-anchoring transpeptidase ErfK/SrfK
MPKQKIHLLFALILFLTPYAAASSAELEAARLLQAERALSNLGYWVLKTDGVPDASTRHAIAAFQKVEGLKRTGELTPEVFEKLMSASRPMPQYDTGAAHVEVDIKRQVLFLTDDENNVVRILPVSTGSEQKYFDAGIWQVSHTPRGTFKILWQVDGTRHSSLGELYYPSYFHGGVAIHGSNSIPFGPASHGCVRIPRYADKAFSRMVSAGMEVYVYDDYLVTSRPETKPEIAINSWFTPVDRLFDGQRIFSRELITSAVFDQNWIDNSNLANNRRIAPLWAISTVPVDSRVSGRIFAGV